MSSLLLLLLLLLVVVVTIIIIITIPTVPRRGRRKERNTKNRWDVRSKAKNLTSDLRTTVLINDRSRMRSRWGLQFGTDGTVPKRGRREIS